MKKHNARRIKVRRRKVAQLRAYSLQHSVYNMPNNKPTFEKKNLIKVIFGKDDVHYVQKSIEWKSEKWMQPKKLHHAHKGEKWIHYKDGTCELIKWKYKSQLAGSCIGIKMKRQDYIDAFIQHKIEKWERRNPKPCKDNDLFKEEYLTKWQTERDAVIKRIRDFVVAIYDNKLKLYGRYKKSEKVFEEKKIAEIKDKTGEGNDINNLDPSTSPLLKTAQKITDKEKRVNPSLVATNLKDRNNKKGRLILPRAA